MRRSEGGYPERQPTCVVIAADIQCEETQFLDLLNNSVKERLASVFVAKRVDRLSEKEQAAFYDKFFAEYEKPLGIRIKVINSMVAPPRPSSYPITVLGAPTALLVREASCIRITPPIEEVDDVNA